MNIALLIILGLYFIAHIVLFIGLMISIRKPFGNNYSPTVTVIVAAKNEEENIAGCIESLLKLDYPNELLEIMLVNDHSTDRTKEIMMKYVNANTVLKYIETGESIGKLKGKTNALAVSIKQAKGEIIFTTDADIKVKPGWLREMLKYYDEETGVVSSFSTIEPKNAYWGIQSFDWLYLLGIASSGDGLNHPISCLGNNMSYRMAAYNEVGGYENIKFSVTEDFMLLQTIRNKTKWKSKFPANFLMMNETYPCKDLHELYRQKKRWGKGGTDSHSAGMIVALIVWLGGMGLLFGWLAGWKIFLLYAIFKMIIDAIYILPVVKEFRMWKVYLYLPLFELYMAVYMIVVPISVTFGGRVVWKEEKM
jgi:cellulose synthase/poly-beta-1,6-N-acetylglucosamine synthase-like glycosyltransferase